MVLKKAAISIEIGSKSRTPAALQKVEGETHGLNVVDVCRPARLACAQRTAISDLCATSAATERQR